GHSYRVSGIVTQADAQIEFEWDLNWIRDQFGEIPQGVDYSQNILQVLNDIQSEKGAYFQSRQDINREIRNKQAFIADIAADIPANYQAEVWENYDLATKYAELMKRKEHNNRIERAKAFAQTYQNKLRGIQAEHDITVSAAKDTIAAEKEGILQSIARLKAEITAAEHELETLGGKLDDKIKVADAEYQEQKAKLDADVGAAQKYMDIAPLDIADLQEEIQTAEEMKKHLNEYRRMRTMQAELDVLREKSKAFTEKIELARSLPGEILQEATLPVEGLTVENGVPLIHGLPITNCSDGEKLELCVDVAIHNPSGWQIILIDGAEKLDDASRKRLYAKCKEKGLQFIATRTTNDNELEVTEL
ncbi:MAG: hypothetical protein II346_03800, partial [Ruminococcus sp.]|nr:hypothetical protein [Ruminococcus sp.]